MVGIKNKCHLDRENARNFSGLLQRWKNKTIINVVQIAAKCIKLQNLMHFRTTYSLIPEIRNKFVSKKRKYNTVLSPLLFWSRLGYTRICVEDKLFEQIKAPVAETFQMLDDTA